MAKAISLDPSEQIFYNNRGIVLVLRRIGRADEAIVHFDRACALDLSYPRAYYDNLGVEYGRACWSALVVPDFQKTCESWKQRRLQRIPAPDSGSAFIMTGPLTQGEKDVL
jgi:tetratricopeptide (TPR) repeat protein